MLRLIAILIAAIALASCSSDDSSETAEITSDTESHISSTVDSAPDSSDPDSINELEEEERNNQTVEVVDKDGKHLGEISHKGGITVTDKGILYNAYMENSSENKNEFLLFDPKTGKSKRLGWIEGEVYEPVFNRVEIGDHVYTIAVVGDLLDNQPHPAYLVDIDMNGATITHTISDDAFPYMTLCRHGDKLLYMLHDQQDVLYDRVFEYDLKNGNKKEVITSTLDKGEKGDTLRQLWSDGEKVYVLRVKMNTRSDVKLFIDTYDKDYNKLSEKEITDLVKKTSHLAPNDDINNEIIQMVSHFRVLDGRYVYYENFSVTRFLADLETGELLTDTNGMFSAMNGSGKTSWYWMLGGSESGKEVGLNAIFELKDGKIEKSLLNDPSVSKYQIQTASVSPNGSNLFYLAAYKNSDTGEELPPLLVLIEGE